MIIPFIVAGDVRQNQSVLNPTNDRIDEGGIGSKKSPSEKNKK